MNDWLECISPFKKKKQVAVARKKFHRRRLLFGISGNALFGK